MMMMTYWLKVKSVMMIMYWSKDQNIMMMMLFENWSMIMVLIMMLLIRMWWCCWSKGQNAEDVFADRKIKVLKILLIKMLKILVMIERSKCWICCCWSKGQSVEDVAENVADRKVKVPKMMLFERHQDAEEVVADQNSQSVAVTKD